VYQGANFRAILKTNDERESGQNAGHVDAGVPSSLKCLRHFQESMAGTNRSLVEKKWQN
jgi:hypothetical protein